MNLYIFIFFIKPGQFDSFITDEDGDSLSGQRAFTISSYLCPQPSSNYCLMIKKGKQGWGFFFFSYEGENKLEIEMTLILFLSLGISNKSIPSPRFDKRIML